MPASVRLCESMNVSCNLSHTDRSPSCFGQVTALYSCVNNSVPGDASCLRQVAAAIFSSILMWYTNITVTVLCCMYMYVL